MIQPDEGPREVPCPKCRGDANWRFLNEAKSVIEVTCADCGQYQVPRADFEQAEIDVVELGDR